MRLILLILCCCAIQAGAALAGGTAEPALPPGGPLPLAAEAYHYGIDFLVFHDLAEGELRLDAGPVPGRYRAELVGRTLGVASWLSGDRVQRYVAEMEEDGAGGLRSLTYQSSICKLSWGKWDERSKLYRFDDRRGSVSLERIRNGVSAGVRSFTMPPGPRAVDMLTGFYNLRRGFYGPLVSGAKLAIPTFTTRGVSTITVEVLSAPPAGQAAFFPAGGKLLRVLVDPEVFDTRGAAIYVWFDDAGRPARGIVGNVIGLGDVYGYLHQEEKAP